MRLDHKFLTLAACRAISPWITHQRHAHDSVRRSAMRSVGVGSGENYRLQDIQLSKSSHRHIRRLSDLAIGTQKSPNHHIRKLGGEYRARTGDLLVANQALSQLS